MRNYFCETNRLKTTLIEFRKYSLQYSVHVEQKERALLHLNKTNLQIGIWTRLPLPSKRIRKLPTYHYHYLCRIGMNVCRHSTATFPFRAKFKGGDPCRQPNRFLLSQLHITITILMSTVFFDNLSSTEYQYHKHDT